MSPPNDNVISSTNASIEATQQTVDRLNLTVIPIESRLHNITLYEPIDAKLLDKLINSSLLKTEFSSKMTSSRYENEKALLQKFKKIIKNGKAEVLYKQTSNMKLARVFPNKSLGLYNIRRELRHTLARDNFVDLDIDNCHPVVLYQLCRANNVKCKYLKQYVNNRDAILKEVQDTYKVDRDTAKKLFIQLLYFGTFKSWCNGNNVINGDPSDFIKNFQKEVQSIGDIIVQYNPNVKKLVEKNKKDKNKTDFNLKASICSFFLQEYENQILEEIYFYCLGSGLIRNLIAVLCADGLMLQKEHYKPELLLEFNVLIKDKLGFDLSFSKKEMNQGYTLEEIEAAQIEKGKFEGVYNDLEAAEVVYKLYPHFVCCKGALFCFDDSTGLWTESEEIIFRIISRFNDHLYVLTKTNDDTIKKTTKGYGNSTVLQRQMLPQLKTLCINNEWVTKSQFSSIGKLLYQNGYLDMKTGIFYDEFKPEVVFFYQIFQNYDASTLDRTYIEDIKQRYFYNQLGEEVGNYLILNIARGLAGDMMKKIFFGLGETNAGKSTIVTACTNAFGDYIGAFNAENFSNKMSSSDEAQLMRWALLLRYKRIIFSNELKNSTELSVNMLKKHSSGGDVLTGRIHGGLEAEFIPHYLAFCMANDLPKINGFDAPINDRLNIIGYKKRFVDEPTNEFELKIDHNLKDEMKTTEFRNAFNFLITEAYLNYIKCGKKEVIPEAVKNSKIEWVGADADNININKFLEDYEISNDINDYTPSKDIEMWLKTENISISMTKFTMELKKYCSIHKFINVVSKDKKIGGKCRQAWIGIKKCDEYDPDDKISSLDV